MGIKQGFNKMKKVNNVIDLIVAETDSLRDVIMSMNKSGARICLVADTDLKLTGIITDGDLRRALIRGLSLETLAHQAMNQDFTTIDSERLMSDVSKFALKNGLQHLPMVDSSGRIKGLWAWALEPVTEIHNTPVVIMAGGRGERLKPLTDSIPKPMLEFRGRPILEHILMNSKNQGFHNFYISINYLGQMIEDHFGDGSKFGVKIQYLRENFPLGTAGALGELSESVESEFLVMNGDLYTNIDLEQFLNYHIERDSDFTIAVREHSLQNPFGVLEFDKDGSINSFLEKPTIYSQINAGIYLIKARIIKAIDKNQYMNMSDLIHLAIDAKYALNAYPIVEKWTDIGSIADFKALE